MIRRAPSRPGQDRLFMLRRTIPRAVGACAIAAGALALSGCNMAVMDPKGPVGAQEKDLIILAMLLMLIPVVPVIVMTLWFGWRYRASNTKATYAPDFEHSNRIEAVVWAIPTLIIVALGAVTWVSTHQLDPRKTLTAASASVKAKPVEVEVVSLDWKWLFIYPDYGVASVNEMALPVGTPVHFKLTSATVMDSFFIPQLGSQIYTMTGMQTQLSLRADKPGTYEGVSANYSGSGFAGMKFSAIATDQAGFDAWINKARASNATLDTAAYQTLARRGLGQTGYYAAVDPALFHQILNNCADGKLCTDSAMKMAALQSAVPGAKMCLRADATPQKSPPKSFSGPADRKS
jgi:cytochrome o ubiquinol oxidase subunit 2